MQFISSFYMDVSMCVEKLMGNHDNRPYVSVHVGRLLRLDVWRL